MRHRIGLLSVLVACSVCLSGCSFTDTMQSLVGKITHQTTGDTGDIIHEEGVKVEPKTVDGTLSKPVFDDALIVRQNVPLGAAVTLQTQASVEDGGTVTYQWFRNTVDSNGGGSAIDGATDPSYTADTSAGGTSFYFVVATNTKDGRVHMATSGVYQVTVWEDMYWQQNADLLAYQYMSRVDGKYPVSTSMVIDGKEYIFDAEGFAVNAEGQYLDVQTGEPIPTPTPEPTPTPTPEPTPEATPEAEEEAAAEETPEEPAAETEEEIVTEEGQG